MKEAFRSVGLLCALALPATSQRWEMQYFYDQSKSMFAIRDLAFPSPKRGIAVGAILEGTKAKPVAVTTNDGGVTWSQSPLEEEPNSLFFLNDSLGDTLCHLKYRLVAPLLPALPEACTQGLRADDLQLPPPHDARVPRYCDVLLLR